jgi:hypothetical protein
VGRLDKRFLGSLLQAPSPTLPQIGKGVWVVNVLIEFFFLSILEKNVTTTETPEESNICSPGCSETEPGDELASEKQGASTNLV